MNQESNKRRHFIKAGLTIPMLASMPWNTSIAKTIFDDRFLVPYDIHHELLRIYGEQANNIKDAEKLRLVTAEIAENGPVVPVHITGEKGRVSSLAIFVERNQTPLTSTCVLHEGSDLPVSLRIKVEQSSYIYLIAQTKEGLSGIKQEIKVTIGCGGG